MLQPFLARLREDPDDRTTWLVYADWLDDHDDPTGRFIRLSLELTGGAYPIEEAEALIGQFEKLYAISHPETRQAMADYRSALPVRFRVLSKILIGENPPREMFDYARTVAIGFLEAGRLKPGAILDVPPYPDGQSRVLLGIDTFYRIQEELVAGSEPIQAGLCWLGHLNLEPGRLLREAPRPAVNTEG
jgi:uncharacterized protein (TIGR02996 family)